MGNVNVMENVMKDIVKLGDIYIDDAVDLTSGMIKIKSFSGKEKNMAAFTTEVMNKLNYDDIRVDKAGSVIGKIKGTGKGKALIFNCHLDTVGEGSLDSWGNPPFNGLVKDGFIHGRGASDTKGAFAAQIYAAAILKREGLLPRGDIYVTGVVHEEDSGLGSITLLESVKADYAVIGEATSNCIAVYHRGRMRFDIHMRGKSAHASTPQLAVNPHFYLAEFLRILNQLEVETDPIMGKSSFAPTLIRTSEVNTNTIPAKLILSIDYRNVDSDTPEKVREKLEVLARRCTSPIVEVAVERVKNSVNCYTGYKGETYEGEPSFIINKNHELVKQSRIALEGVFGHKVDTIGWNFATDCGHFTAAGIPAIGFSPAEGRYCHTTEEKIDINMLKKGLIGNMALISRLCNG